MALASERGLWAAVLFQQVVDLGSANRLEAETAEAWIGDRVRPDFAQVCHMAGVDPQAVHARIRREFLALPREARREVLRRRAQEGATPAHWCAVPGCGAALPLFDRTGTCAAHRHEPGACRCRGCA